MKEINWVQIIIGFVSGGVFGALIKQFFDNRRNRIQPIGYSLEIKSFFDSGDNKLIKSEVILKDEVKEYKFSKLFTGTLVVVNSGLSDYSDFTFGITVSGKVKVIQINPTTSDRHHNADFAARPSLGNQINSFDILLKPFNRKDKYTFDFLLTSEDATITESDLQISSSKPVKWAKLISATEVILEVANRTLLEIIAHNLIRIIRV